MTLQRPMFPPVDPTRRRFISIAAGASVASVGSLAAAGMPGLTPVDPIYVAIERHKAACAVWAAAVDVRSRFNDHGMTDEQRRQRDELDDAEDAAREPLDQAGMDLVTTEPTTPAGIVAAIGYLKIQMRDDGTFMPHEIEFEYDDGSEGDGGVTLGWVDAFLDTIADATASIAQAVQS